MASDRSVDPWRSWLQGSAARDYEPEFAVALTEFVRTVRRDQGEARPVHLGLATHRSWSPEADRELTFEFATQQLLPQLDSLRARLRTGGSAAGYLRRMIVNWLVDVQRDRDPLGSASFQTLRAGVLRAVEDGRLTLSPDVGEGRHRSMQRSLCTVVGANPDRPLWRQPELRARLDLLPDGGRLRKRFTTKGRVPPQELQGYFEDLREIGCPGFEFQELLSALKEFAGIVNVQDSHGPDGELSHIAMAGDDGQGRADLDAIESRLDLHVLLEGCRQRVRESAELEGKRASVLMVIGVIEGYAVAAGDEVPNFAAIGRGLGISKQRMSELRHLLRDLCGERVVGWLEA